MRFSLIPREMKFFDMFDEASVLLNRAADKFLAMFTHFDRLVERSNGTGRFSAFAAQRKSDGQNG